MYISKRKIEITSISVLAFIIIYSVFFYINKTVIGFDDITLNYSIIILVTLIIQIATLKMLGNSFSSPIVLFLLFCYMFHFGQVVTTNNYDFDYLNYYRFYIARDIGSLKETITLCFNAINATYFGMLISTLLFNSKNNTKAIIETDERNTCYIVGLSLFFISSPFRFYRDIRSLLVALTQGYDGVNSLTSISGVLGALGGFWYSSLVLLYLGKRDKRIIWLGIAYTAITMLTGNRGHQLTNILLMIIVYIHVEKIRFSISGILKYGCFAYIGLVFIDMIMNFRNVGISHFFDNFRYYLEISLKTNILLETIGSFGETIYTPFLVLREVGKDVFPFIGEAWIFSIFTLIPNIGGITTYTNLHSNYPKMLMTSHAIGGSYVGDLFYNFRGGYWVVAFLVGLLLSNVSLQYHDAINKKMYSKLIYYIPVIYNSFWWVRDSLGNLTRPLIWQIAFSAFIVYLYSKQRGKNVTHE